MDLLGDLDLDFLNVHGGGGDDGDGMMFDTMDDIVGNNNNSMGENNDWHPAGGEQMMQQPGGVNDGIGDLDFNGDFSNPAMEPPQVVSNYSHQFTDLKVH